MKRVTSISFGLLVLASALGSGMGCGKGAKDSGPVLASVGGEKITAAEFKDLVERMAPDAAKAKLLLEDADPRMRSQRNDLLASLASANAMIQVAKVEGLDQDPRVKAELKVAMAAAYRRAMLARRVTGTPTEADLKAFYDRYAKQAKEAGQPMPPYEQVKAQLGEAWRRDQQDRAMAQLDEEIAKRVPTTYAEGYAPVVMKGM